ncbi:MAG TPA: flagellar hook capping FlgD N-terminal domain-containing protein [Acidobacteriaceae bacterium]
MSQNVSANYTLPTVLDTLKTTSATAKAGTLKANASSDSSTSTSSVGTTFLNLLVKELQNQDPTAPMDSTAMVGQMISLNQLDQLISINEILGGTATSNASSTPVTNAMAKTATTATDSAASMQAQTAAVSQLPFDPNTLMPVSTSTNASGTAAFLNSPLNASSMGIYGSNNSISGGK